MGFRIVSENYYQFTFIISSNCCLHEVILFRFEMSSMHFSKNPSGKLQVLIIFIPFRIMKISNYRFITKSLTFRNRIHATLIFCILEKYIILTF